MKAAVVVLSVGIFCATLVGCQTNKSEAIPEGAFNAVVSPPGGAFRRSPVVVLTRDDLVPTQKLLGEWVRIDEAATAGLGETWYVAPFSLMVTDIDQTLTGINELKAGLMVQHVVHQPNPSQGPMVPAGLQSLPITYGPAEGVTPATLRGFTQAMKWTNEHTVYGPNETDYAVFGVDATKAGNFGAQIQATGAAPCNSSVLSSLPGRSPATLTLAQGGNVRKPAACVLSFRLCAMPSHPLYSAATACTAQ